MLALPLMFDRIHLWSHLVLDFCPWSQCTWKPVCACQEWGLYFPQSRGAPAHSPTGLQCQMLQVLFFPMPNPHAWGPKAQDSHSCRWVSVIVNFQSAGCPPGRVGLLISCNHPSYYLDVASSLSSGVGYLFLIVCSLVDGCSAVACNFVAFMREGELQYFYSAIFPSSPLWVPLCDSRKWDTNRETYVGMRCFSDI